MLSRFPLDRRHNDLPWVIREKFGLDPVKAGLTGRVEGTDTDIPRLVGAGRRPVLVGLRPVSLAATRP